MHQDYLFYNSQSKLKAQGEQMSSIVHNIKET